MFKRKLTPGYDTFPSISHQFRFKFSKKDIAGKKLLDVGCWTGQYLALARRMADCTGIDIERKAIVFAKRNHPKVEFCVASVLDLPFKDKSFEIVTFWDVIEHLPPGTEPKALSEINRVLKARGILFLSTLSDHPISLLFDPAFFLQQHRHYSPEDLRRLLKNAGFKIERTHSGGGALYMLYYWTQMFCKHVLKRAPFKIKWLEKKAERELKRSGFLHLSIRARKEKVN